MDLSRLKAYTDGEGLMTPNYNPGPWSTGNGVLYSGMTAHLLEGANHPNKDYIDAITNTEVKPGLYDRNKTRKDKNSYDDHVGASVSGDFHAERVWKHCITHLGFFNNQEPNKPALWAWHLRRPDVIMFYAISANSVFKYPLAILWSILLYFTLQLKISNSGLLLRYFMLSRAITKASCLKHIFKYFLKKVDIASVANSYFGYNHPIAEWIRSK